VTGAVVVWEVSADAHVAFTELSGDVNPIHTDPLVARRLPFGQVVAHGVHLLVRALDQWAAGHPERGVSHVSATFRHPVAVGAAVTTEWADVDDDCNVNISVNVNGVRAVEISAKTTNRRVAFSGEWRRESRHDSPLIQPRVWTIDELVDQSGSVPVAVDSAAAASSFPALANAAGAAAMAQLITLSTLVGVHVPGLHSMVSSLHVSFEGHDLADERLNYSVTRVDRRFSRVTIDVEASAIAGRVIAFVRPAPVDQSVDTSAVRSAEFAGQRWLIIGGSRGLGAAAVRLLVAGGADVRFTYHQGYTESVELSAETGSIPLRFDVFSGDIGGRMTALTDGWQPTHLGWFASPPIFVGARDSYDDMLYQRFVRAYVDAFAAAVDALAQRGLVGALWPSSEAAGVTVPGLAEYSDAKRLGEARCVELRRRWPGLTVAAPRLPRLLTDQTTTFVPTEFGDTATELVAALRATL
jgi:acyl dehydratase